MPYYLADQTAKTGREKEAEITRTRRGDRHLRNAYGDIRQGFVYERVPHITLRDIANNAEIDVVWDEYQVKLEPCGNN